MTTRRGYRDRARRRRPSACSMSTFAPRSAAEVHSVGSTRAPRRSASSSLAFCSRAPLRSARRSTALRRSASTRLASRSRQSDRSTPRRSARAEHGQREVHLDQLHRPHAAFGEHRAEEAAMPKRAVPQRSPSKRAVAERRADMLGFGQIDAAEVAFGEHDALGAQPAQIVVARSRGRRIPARSRPFRLRPRGQPRTGVRLFSAYSVTAISAALAEWRSRASTVMIGMSSRSASALRTA